MKDFINGLKSYGKAIPFLFKKWFWLYAIFPFVVFLLVFSVGYYLNQFKYFNLPKEDDGLMLSIYYYLLDGLILILSFALLNLTRYLMLGIISPILSVISQRTEKMINSKKYDFSLKQLIKDVKRAIQIIFRNLIYETGIIISIIILFKIIGYVLNELPIVLQWIEKGLIILIAFYYYGFSFMDYNLERWKINVAESAKYVRKHWGIALAIGSVFTPIFHYVNEFILIDKIDYISRNNDYYILVILSALICAIIPVWSMIACTIAMSKMTDLDDNTVAIKEIT